MPLVDTEQPIHTACAARCNFISRHAKAGQTAPIPPSRHRRAKRRHRVSVPRDHSRKSQPHPHDRAETRGYDERRSLAMVPHHRSRQRAQDADPAVLSRHHAALRGRPSAVHGYLPSHTPATMLSCGRQGGTGPRLYTGLRRRVWVYGALNHRFRQLARDPGSAASFLATSPFADWHGASPFGGVRRAFPGHCVKALIWPPRRQWGAVPKPRSGEGCGSPVVSWDPRPLAGRLVRAAGLEPAWACARGILSPMRLPFRHARAGACPLPLG